MLDYNLTPSVPAIKMSDNELTDYPVKLLKQNNHN